MRFIKMLGLAAMASMVAMAFIGASSASANNEYFVLCQNAQLLCTNPFPNPTTIVGHATNPRLLSSIGTIECESALIEITILNTLAQLVLGHILSLSYTGNCHLGGTSCSITTTQLGGVSILKLAGLRAHFRLVTLYLGEEKTEPMLTETNVKCGSFINCTYNDSSEAALEGTSTEEGETSLEANEVEVGVGKGFLCPKTMKLDVTYVILGQKWIES